jgi:hypothetical protein
MTETRATGAEARPRLQLRDVTVCAADSLTPTLAARALELCIDRCDFGDALLFSDTPVAGRFRHVAIDRLNSLHDYSGFCLRTMPGLIETEFALVVQWDGYVVNPGAWASGFRKYDYIGAPIYDGRGLRGGGDPPVVGNGGFSLRSRKLLDALPRLPFLPGISEDWIISSVLRKPLEEDFGVRFAPLALADRFAHEVRLPTRPTFGFHGIPNLWRYESDAEVLAILASVPPRSLVSNVFFLLLVNCLRNGREPLAGSLYELLRKDHSAQAIIGQMTRWIPLDMARQTIAALEQAAEGRVST